MRIRLNLLFFLFISIGHSQEEKVTRDFELTMEAEYRYFPKDAAFEGQKDHFPSLAIRPEYSLSWNQGDDVLNFKGFFRLDVDDERSHWDIRELYYQKTIGKLA
ncbi:MAG: hypothetical protein AAF600_05230 [Bacteroidota bacterium]